MSFGGMVSNEFVLENKDSPENENVGGLLERLPCVESLFPLTLAIQEMIETPSRTVFKSDDVISKSFWVLVGPGVVGGALKLVDGARHDRGSEPQRLASMVILPIDRGIVVIVLRKSCNEVVSKTRV